MATGFHFGTMLRKIIAERKYTRAEITKAMGVSAPSLYPYEERSSLQLSIVLKLCHAMKYNILMDIANKLPADYDYDSKAKAAQQQQLILLEEENKKLKWENDLLKELILKKG